MRILILGGSGKIGTMLIPGLHPEYSVRVLDLVEPPFACDDFVRGSVLDNEILVQAVDGMDVVIYAAMSESVVDEAAPNDLKISTNQDINVKGLHLALDAARCAGIRKAIYLSTFNIFRNFFKRIVVEDELPETHEVYGFTKILGEFVCRMFGECHDMTVIALRLYYPLSDLEWHARAVEGKPFRCLAASDLVELIRCSLRLEQTGYHAFSASGDYEEKTIQMGRTREVLGWAPQARP